jgi:acyl carrier protein
MSADVNQVKTRLREIIAHELDANIPIDHIQDDVSLFEDGIGLDSISIVQFIVRIERSFGFSFAEQEINTRLFGSINNLAEFINGKIVSIPQ